MSGVECAGLVLAVLPLVVETAKAYSRGIDSVIDVLSSSRADTKLQSFYEELWWEVFLLNRQLRDVIHALPHIEEDRKAVLLNAENLDQWTSGSDVTKALQDFFNSRTDFDAFTLIMSKIVQLLGQLVRVSAGRVKQEETVGLFFPFFPMKRNLSSFRLVADFVLQGPVEYVQEA